MNRRSWSDITIDILETTLHPTNKMRVMYRSNLNFQRFNKYFYDLLTKGFIEKMGNGNGGSLYRTTERGKTLLDVLRKAHELAARDRPTD